MEEKPLKGSVGTGQTPRRSRAVPNLRSSLPRAVAGIESGHDFGSQCRARLPGKTSSRQVAEKRAFTPGTAHASAQAPLSFNDPLMHLGGHALIVRVHRQQTA